MGDIENRSGTAGEYIVASHLLSLGFKTAVLSGGGDIDIVSKIGGVWREFQVKAHLGSRSFGAGGGDYGWLSTRKKLSELQVCAFAFCFLQSPYPYYVAKEGIRDNITFPNSSFSRAARDLSFDELLRRWRVIENNTPAQHLELV